MGAEQGQVGALVAGLMGHGDGLDSHGVPEDRGQPALALSQSPTVGSGVRGTSSWFTPQAPVIPSQKIWRMLILNHCFTSGRPGSPTDLGAQEILGVPETSGALQTPGAVQTWEPNRSGAPQTLGVPQT